MKINIFQTEVTVKEASFLDGWSPPVSWPLKLSCPGGAVAPFVFFFGIVADIRGVILPRKRLGFRRSESVGDLMAGTTAGVSIDGSQLADFDSFDSFPKNVLIKLIFGKICEYIKSKLRMKRILSKITKA